MRSVHLSDLDAVARVLLAVPASEQYELAQKIIETAKTSDAYRKRTGKILSGHGPGTLAGAAAAYPRSPCGAAHSQQYLRAIGVLVSAILEDAKHQFG